MEKTPNKKQNQDHDENHKQSDGPMLPAQRSGHGGAVIRSRFQEADAAGAQNGIFVPGIAVRKNTVCPVRLPVRRQRKVFRPKPAGGPLIATIDEAVRFRVPPRARVTTAPWGTSPRTVVMLLMAVGASITPIMMIMQPVTTGGKKSVILFTPNSLTSPANQRRSGTPQAGY